MTLRAVVVALTLMIGFVGPWSRAEPVPMAVPVKVDPRVELLSIVFRLAGNPEYNMPNSASAYATDVEKHFAAYRNHPAVQRARQLRQKRGVSFDAVMSFAVHLEPSLLPKLRLPLEPWPAQLDTRWTTPDAKTFVDLLNKFAVDSKFQEFVDAHADHYAKCAERLSTIVERHPIVPWFDRYFGQRPSAKYTVIVGLLEGGGNYGVSCKLADGAEEITPVIGIYKWDAQGLPAIGDEVYDTLIHEFCHTYTNALVDKHADALRPAAKKLYEPNKDRLKNQAYGDPTAMLYESMVRACVVRALADTQGERAANMQARREACSGFPWTIDLVELLRTKYETDRTTYPTLDAFMPRVIEFFNAAGNDYDGLLKKFPKVVSMTPAANVRNVPVTTKELVITFDRPMTDQSWALVTMGKDRSPEWGKPSYNADRTVLTVPMTLKPGKQYLFGLNASRFIGFLSDDGQPLLPVEVTFRTAGGSAG
ncbi:MAG: DUF4932 domain-containing protein [Tepidisphaeraceae bacterium]